MLDAALCAKVPDFQDICGQVHGKRALEVLLVLSPMGCAPPWGHG